MSEKKFADARAVLRPAVEKHAIPASAEAAQKLLAEIDAAEADAKIETAKREEIEKGQQIEQRYAEAMQPIEELVAAWDFREARAALAKVQFEEGDLAARLAAWREGVRRLEDLKSRIIAKINTAAPRLKKSDLQIRGAGGEVVNADGQGIETTLSTGKTESLPWPDVGPQAIEKLIGLVSTSDTPDDRLAAGILCLASKDPSSAERHFDKARALGADIGPYLAPLAATAFARAQDFLEAEKFSEAEALLTNIEAKYTDTAWFASNRTAFEAVRAEAKAGVYEVEAERLYLDAAELFQKEQLFDVKPLVEKLRTEYANSQPVTDTARKCSFADMEKAVADLGQFITVRQDGNGDFTSIQAAINAAPPKSLIDIQDAGPYRESIEIRQNGLTITGSKDAWPVITSFGAEEDIDILVSVRAPHVALQRLLLLHSAPIGGNVRCVSAGDVPFTVRSATIYMPGSAFGVFCTWHGHGRLDDSIVMTNTCTGHLDFENCLFPLGGKISFSTGSHKLKFCTVAGQAGLWNTPCVVADSVVRSVQFHKPGHKVENCVLWEANPFSGGGAHGVGCVTANPQFRDPGNLDCRLMPTSPCIGKASDGGDIGCRYTPKMIEMVQKILELRAQGTIKF